MTIANEDDSRRHRLPDPVPKFLNVGCGYDIRKGYLNVDNGDWHGPDLVADITDLPMLPADYFEEIVAQDVLEHIQRSAQVASLREWGRLLSSTGTLKVRVPSFYDMAILSRRADFQTEEMQQYLVQMVYGTQAYPGDFHLCGYTPWTLKANARDAGLIVTDIRLKDDWLYDVTLRRADALGLLSDEDWVRYVYLHHLDRLADEEGFLFWTSELRRPRTREDVLSAIRAVAG
ncbi:DUF4214 domain-containing protein [Methylobacterium trifolii]|uniref:DUF4214 domain-containing protein n=1 Tax=Methylobacterium trifolii TaxID=1003092 RepID=A0ABQ4TX37_9HYPH|nr:DUF4214 domain-containing protein [Methylobacterium trifolii]GJE59834.1 hypothetical protein MPOCJGCO_1936 [Methylobacterium trifolii]